MNCWWTSSVASQQHVDGGKTHSVSINKSTKTFCLLFRLIDCSCYLYGFAHHHNLGILSEINSTSVHSGRGGKASLSPSVIEAIKCVSVSVWVSVWVKASQIQLPLKWATNSKRVSKIINAVLMILKVHLMWYLLIDFGLLLWLTGSLGFDLVRIELLYLLQWLQTGSVLNQIGCGEDSFRCATSQQSGLLLLIRRENQPTYETVIKSTECWTSSESQMSPLIHFIFKHFPQSHNVLRLMVTRQINGSSLHSSKCSYHKCGECSIVL